MFNLNRCWGGRGKPRHGMIFDGLFTSIVLKKAWGGWKKNHAIEPGTVYYAP
jgi:hypothetical protein